MVHKEILSDEKEKLEQEKKDLDYMKIHNPSGYQTGEDKLNYQDEVIDRVAERIHRLRDR